MPKINALSFCKFVILSWNIQYSGLRKHFHSSYPQSLRFPKLSTSTWVIRNATQGGIKSAELFHVNIVNRLLMAPDNKLQESSHLQIS